MTRTCALCGATLYLPGESGCGVCDACFNDELAWYNLGEPVMGESVSYCECSIDDPEFNEEEVDYIIA